MSQALPREFQIGLLIVISHTTEAFALFFFFFSFSFPFHSFPFLFHFFFFFCNYDRYYDVWLYHSVFQS